MDLGTKRFLNAKAKGDKEEVKDFGVFTTQTAPEHELVANLFPPRYVGYNEGLSPNFCTWLRRKEAYTWQIRQHDRAAILCVQRDD